MGGRTLTAMNLCNFPARNIDTASLRKILEGGFSKIKEAGATLVGGHTVRDDELKYGLSVTGIIDPRRILTNAAARPGDHLVLTKPIGTGVIITGYRRGLASDDLLMRAVNWMAMLNRVSCETMLEFDPHSCTDITGFGLSGHALGMAKASNVRMRMRFEDIPKYDESLALIGQGVATSVTNSTLQVAQDYLTFSGPFSNDEKGRIVDPQTSGGLFTVLPAEQAPRLVARLRERGNPIAAVIGEVVPADGRPGLEFLK